jgi:DNA-binding CsgD family transcriptional regulator
MELRRFSTGYVSLEAAMSDGGPGRSGSAGSRLFGRDKDVEYICGFIDEASVRGGALLLSGEPGVGKTAVLEATASAASAAGTRVLRAAGAEFGAELSFSGLSQLLRPLRAEFRRLSAAHRDALTVALGFGEGPPSDRLVVSNAALILLHKLASAQPLLLVIDDLPWLDRPSAAVLGFIARRLGGSRAGFLAALRSGHESFFERAGLPMHELQPLGDDAAAGLLDARFPALGPRVRQRLLAEARGNPLALLELPAALSGPQRAALRALPAVLPLNRRLQAVFASRANDMPARTRHLLLLAALEGTGDLALILAAALPAVADDLAPAERAQLVHVDDSSGRLTFSHPMTRSAVVENSTSAERRAAHRALAENLTGQPRRRAWHLADASAGPDEEVADLLEQLAHGSLWRGDAVGAVAALLRAADASQPGPDRSRRMAEAAFVGAIVTGELHSVPGLLDEARRADPQLSGSLHAAVAATFVLLNGDGDIPTVHRLVTDAIETRAGPYDADDSALLMGLFNLFLVCWCGGHAELWEPFHAALARFTPAPPADLWLLSRTNADPVRTAAAALGELDSAIRGLPTETNEFRILTVSSGAIYTDRLAACREPLRQVLRDGREGGAITLAISALRQLCIDAFFAGRWDEAQDMAEEGIQLCRTYDYPLWAWMLREHLAAIAAARGDYDAAQALTDEILGWAVPRGAGQAQTAAHRVAAMAALGQGDYEEAYQQVTAISAPGVLASHTVAALWVLMDLVEAAVRTGRNAEAAAHAAAMRDAGLAAISPRLALLTAGSAAIAAPAHEAAELFEDALAIPGTDLWPFDLARVQLSYGEHLRRARATIDARRHLSAALGTFQRLGARPWAARASDEMRATGLVAPRATAPGSAHLTPQQREIALLAATGLTNKQIGERLFLSPRTVAAHLYQIFPKVGITSRAALRAALADLTLEQPPHKLSAHIPCPRALQRRDRRTLPP